MLVKPLSTVGIDLALLCLGVPVVAGGGGDGGGLEVLSSPHTEEKVEAAAGAAK
jgi:hypothetical protein